MSHGPANEELLFADALARPVQDRAVFLDGACRGRPELRARLDALLAAHEGSPSLLQAPAAVMPARLGAEEKPGNTVLRYKLLQKIGEGGCGVVWMAEQEEPVRRRVALKVIKLGMDTKSVVARFEAERQALAMMDHPNIAKVHDAGATETGRPFFVMELVRGIPITKYCDENHLTPNARLELFIKVCHAIQHAHQKGIIHRDIKPSNILVTVNDGQPTPKVIDFGIAKATQGKLTDATVFTAFEQFIGTPVYMSPEQAEMSSLDIDTRSDIYSLGVLLYELLAGRPPFDPRVFARAGVDEIRKQIREVDPVKPSARLRTLTDEEQTTIAQLRSTAPSELSVVLRGDLDWIIMRCLEKDRTRRYDTTNGLATDIQRYLRHEPVMARPPSTGYLLGKLVRRHRVGVAAALAILGVVIAGSAVSTWQAVRATKAEHEQTRLRIAAEQAQANEATARARAVAGEADARRAADVIRRNAYVAEMNLAQRTLADGNLANARTLLEKYRPKPGEPDLRGFEWRLLWDQTRGDQVAILGRYLGRNAGMGGLALSPDGTVVAISVAPDIEVRSFPSGSPIAVLRSLSPTGNNVGVLRFSPDGHRLYSVGAGLRRNLQVWKTATWELEKALDGAGPTTPFAVFPDGRTMAAREGRRLSLWNTDSWQKIADLPGELPPASGLVSHRRQSLAVSPDGQTLFYGGDERVGIRAWDLRKRSELPPLAPPFLPEFATCLTVSPGGLLAAAHYNGRVTLWNPTTRELLHTFDAHRAWASSVAFSPDGSLLASAGSDQTVVIYRPAEKRIVRRLIGHEGEIWALAFAADNTRLVSGSAYDTTTRVWSLADPPRGTARTIAAESPLAFVDSDRRLLCWSQGAGLITLDRATGRATEEGVLTFAPGATPARDVRIAPTASLLARVTEGEVEIWNVRSGVRERVLKGRGKIGAVEFSPDGSLFCAADGQAGVRLWNTRTWTAEDLPPGQTGEVWRIAFSTNQRYVALVSSSRHVLVYDLSSREPPAIFDHPARNGSVALSPDGTRLVAGTTDNLIRVWDVGRRERIADLRGHLAGVFTVAFSPDGRTLASGGGNVVKLWDAATLQEIFTFPNLPSPPHSAIFSADSNALAVGTLGGQVHVWRAPSWAEIEPTEKAQATARPGS